MELIKFNHTTKEERSQLVREIFDEVLNGRVNPLELHLRLKSAEEVIKQLTGLEPYKAILLDEAQKHGKSFDYQTAKIDIREVGVKYDYSDCGNSELAALYDQQKAIEARIKVIEIVVLVEIITMTMMMTTMMMKMIKCMMNSKPTC